MLWEEVKKYAELTGLTREEALNVPIKQAGAYLDGYDKGIKVLDKISAEIDRQEKWLFQAGYTAYNTDIAFGSIKRVIADSEVE